MGVPHPFAFFCKRVGSTDLNRSQDFLNQQGEVRDSNPLKERKRGAPFVVVMYSKKGGHHS